MGEAEIELSIQFDPNVTFDPVQIAESTMIHSTVLGDATNKRGFAVPSMISENPQNLTSLDDYKKGVNATFFRLVVRYLYV